MSEFDKKSNVLRAYRIIERFAIIKIKNKTVINNID